MLNWKENMEWKFNENYSGSKTTEIVTSQELLSEIRTKKDSTECKSLVYSVINASTTLISPVVSSDWDDVEFSEDVGHCNDFLMVNLDINIYYVFNNIPI